MGVSEERRARLTVCAATRLATVGGGELPPHSLKFLYPLLVSVHHHQPVWLLGRRERVVTHLHLAVCILSLTHRHLQPGFHTETCLTSSFLCDSTSSFSPSSFSSPWPSCSPVPGGGEGGSSTTCGSYSLASTSVMVKDWAARLVPDGARSCTVECSHYRPCTGVSRYHKRHDIHANMILIAGMLELNELQKKKVVLEDYFVCSSARASVCHRTIFTGE